MILKNVFPIFVLLAFNHDNHHRYIKNLFMFVIFDYCCCCCHYDSIMSILLNNHFFRTFWTKFFHQYYIDNIDISCTNSTMAMTLLTINQINQSINQLIMRKFFFQKNIASKINNENKSLFLLRNQHSFLLVEICFGKKIPNRIIIIILLLGWRIYNLI